MQANIQPAGKFQLIGITFSLQIRIVLKCIRSM